MHEVWLPLSTDPQLKRLLSSPNFQTKVQEIGNGEFKLDVDPQLQCGFERVHASGETIMRQGRAGILQGDPCHSPNLSRERADFSLGK